MKKTVFTLTLALLGFFGSAQFQGTVSGRLTDSSGFAQAGVAVLYYGSIRNLSQATWPPANNRINRFTYTDSLGNFTLNYSVGGTVSTDSVVIGVADCNLAVTARKVHVNNSTHQNVTNINFTNVCRPNECDLLTWSDYWTPGNWVSHAAVPLIDSNYTSSFPIFRKTVNGVSRPATSGVVTMYGAPDTITAMAGDVVSYQYLSSCTPEYFGTSTPPPPSLNCQAYFFVDTVNSINFQGQVVIWEASTVDSTGYISSYFWDFGDGNTSNLRYPQHTYSDTGIYQLCLTIASVDTSTADSCYSTFCDSVGFDANGNLVYKTNATGFTINVVDPATVSLEELDVFESLTLFPNPSSGRAELQWDERLQVQTVELLSTNGQRLQRLEPTDNRLNFDELSPGLYLVRVRSEYGEKSLKLIVR